MFVDNKNFKANAIVKKIKAQGFEDVGTDLVENDKGEFLMVFSCRDYNRDVHKKAEIVISDWRVEAIKGEINLQDIDVWTAGVKQFGKKYIDGAREFYSNRPDDEKQEFRTFKNEYMQKYKHEQMVKGQRTLDEMCF